MTAATNKVESFNRFSQWIGFGNGGVIADNDPIEQEKAMKFNALLTNAVFSELPVGSRRMSCRARPGRWAGPDFPQCIFPIFNARARSPWFSGRIRSARQRRWEMRV